MYQQFACIVLSAASLIDDRPIRIGTTFPQSACAVNTHLLIVYYIYKCLLQKTAAVKDDRVVNANAECFSVIFKTPYHPVFPLGMFPSPVSPFLPYTHVFIVFFCHCNHATARCSQDGIIGENICTAYFSQGFSLANYCLDGSQRFSPITCIFPISCVDASQGSARPVSLVLTLVMVLMRYRKVLHGGTW